MRWQRMIFNCRKLGWDIEEWNAFVVNEDKKLGNEK